MTLTFDLALSKPSLKWWGDWPTPVRPSYTAMTSTIESHLLENGECKTPHQNADITFSASVSPTPGLRRKQLLWQVAVRNIIDQHNLYSLRLAGGLERGRHRIIVTDAYIADINR